MRVGINARSLSAPRIRGWTRYTIQLLKHLPELGAELVLFSDAAPRSEYLAMLPARSYRVVLAPAMRYVAWEQAWLPIACARARVDVLHAPANYGLPLLGTCPAVLTLHDAIDLAFEPEAPSPRNLRQHLSAASFWAARHAARRIITVSAHAKADLVKHFTIPSSKITVIHEASELAELAGSAEDEADAVDQLGIATPHFVLYAGGFERRKNVEFLVEAYRSAALSDVSLVLVGSDPPSWLVNKVAERSQSRRELLTGFLPDAVLTGLYRRALAFVYPSLYEGFGLQLCEAMSFGCPTLAADATSLPEVLGRGGETFSPHQPEALVKLLQRVARDPAFRADLSLRARQRAADFSWCRTAALTYDVYRSCA